MSRPKTLAVLANEVIVHHLGTPQHSENSFGMLHRRELIHERVDNAKAPVASLVLRLWIDRRQKDAL